MLKNKDKRIQQKIDFIVNCPLTPWRNGSPSDSRSESCVFDARRGQLSFFPTSNERDVPLFFIVDQGNRWAAKFKLALNQTAANRSEPCAPFVIMPR